MPRYGPRSGFRPNRTQAAVCVDGCPQDTPYFENEEDFVTPPHQCYSDDEADVTPEEIMAARILVRARKQNNRMTEEEREYFVENGELMEDGCA